MVLKPQLDILRCQREVTTGDEKWAETRGRLFSTSGQESEATNESEEYWLTYDFGSNYIRRLPRQPDTRCR